MVNYDKIKNLSKKQGVSMTHLCNLLSKQRSYLLVAERENRELTSDKIAIIAEALHTTPEYLTDQTDDPGIKKPPPAQDTEGSLLKQKINILFDQLSEDQQRQALDFLAFLKNQEKHQAAIKDRLRSGRGTASGSRPFSGVQKAGIFPDDR